MLTMSRLAALDGPKAVDTPPDDLFTWPIITTEDEQAVLEVLRRGAMSGTDVTQQFEQEFAAWLGVRHTLGTNTGTASLCAAMFACGVGTGDEIICPSMTHWASALPVYSLGGTVVFADVEPDTLCIDPNDIEHRITEHTKAIVVVHYAGYPADMDAILAIARRHNVKVIEDVSHAHGSLYKGRKTGTFGDVAGMSMMSGKSFAIGEAGMLATDTLDLYERAAAFGHYERFRANSGMQNAALMQWAGLPLGGVKNRMHQLSAAVGRVQLRHYDARIAEIQQTMNYFWDLLEGTPGIRAQRPAKDSGSTMGGWYAARGLYRPEALGGLSATAFTQAVRAEGVSCRAGGNAPLHLHPLFNTADIYGHGKPTRIAHTTRDLRQPLGSLPVTEAANARSFSIPWFKHYRPAQIEAYASAFRKVAENYRDLLASDPGDPAELGNWNTSNIG